jgi:hypothetical protein
VFLFGERRREYRVILPIDKQRNLPTFPEVEQKCGSQKQYNSHAMKFLVSVMVTTPLAADKGGGSGADKASCID